MSLLTPAFPFCPQHDSMQCGAACLRMLCQHYGKRYTLEYLSNACAATSEGVSLYGLMSVARQLGFDTQAVRATMDEISQATLPCILHWNQNHFVVLYRIKKGQKFYIADPGKGLVTYDTKDFMSHWASAVSCDGQKGKGIAMILRPTPDFHSQTIGQGKAGGEKRSFRFLFGYTHQYRNYFGHIALGLALGMGLQLTLPLLTQSIVDIGIKDQNIGFIWLVLLGQLVLTLSRTVIGFIRRWLLLHISLRIDLSLVSDFLIKMFSLPMPFFDTRQTGDLIQRMGDHKRINAFLTQQVLSITFSALTFLAFSALLLYYEWVVFLIFMLGSILYACWTALFMRHRKTLDYELFEKQAASNNKTYELITAMQEIKLQGGQTLHRWDWEDTQVNLSVVQTKSLKLQQTQEAGSIFINELKNMLVTVTAATAVVNGHMTLGMMLAIQYIIGQLNVPVEQLMSFLYSAQDVSISLERINEIHRMDSEDSDPGLRTSVADKSQGLTLRNVSFKYDKFAQHDIIDQVSIYIPKGKVTAIVGASGSGKSTLVKLMLGYYPTRKGTISIGGTDISLLNMEWWRRQCGVVMQDGTIFSDTIAKNIAVGEEKIDRQRLMEVTEMACIREHIMSLPLKFDTKIGRDGMGLSQGQRQRILIARAAYHNPEYIFLDEATNSLDANNECRIVENLNTFYKGKTVVIVAHRLSTVKDADQIIVLEQGRVIEAGTHEELTWKHGAYYQLVRNQLELGN